jgi:hypothetical protein
MDFAVQASSRTLSLLGIRFILARKILILVRECRYIHVLIYYISYKHVVVNKRVEDLWVKQNL